MTCGQTCIACADACLAENPVSDFLQCIPLNIDCADVCATLVQLTSRPTAQNRDIIRAAIELCAMACTQCADECERHAGEHEHCAICG